MRSTLPLAVFSMMAKYSGQSKMMLPSLSGPRLDLHKNAEANAVTAMFELPGLRKEDVQIDVHNSRLGISGRKSTKRMDMPFVRGDTASSQERCSFLGVSMLKI